MKDLTELFGEVIYAYTRKDALADGSQIEVTETAKQAGIKYPVFLTDTVWNAYVKVPPGVNCQDEKGRLWDVLWMFRHAASRVRGDTLRFALYVRNDNRRAKMVWLKSTIGARDIDDPQPAITIMMPDED